MNDYYDEWGDDDPLRRRWKLIAAGAAVLLLAGGVGAWRLMADDGPKQAGGDSATQSSVATSTGLDDPAASTASDESSSNRSSDSGAATDPTDPDVSSDASGPTTVDRPTSTSAAAGSASPATTSTSTRTGESADTTTIESTTASTSGATTTAAVVSPPPASATPSSYPTSPDGTPLPVVVIFDTTTITVTGQVPSQAAKDRLALLAVANSQFPDAELIDNMVINPAVPLSVGVRVIELNSARFPEGTAEIRPDHALELDRVVSIMNALPNISVLVIGHADQRGDDMRNFAISDERARAVVNYLLYLGISPTRLSSRAAGATDLLTTGSDDTAFALNRRTEFVFYGLLIE